MAVKRPHHRSLGTVLALWSIGFACIHLAWALGWRAGVPATMPSVDQRPVFLAYDLLAALLMYAAGGVAVAIAAGRGPRWLRTATYAAAALALLRGIPALAIDLATGDLTGLGPLVDAWFVVAGVLGLALAGTVAPIGEGAGRRASAAIGDRAGSRASAAIGVRAGSRASAPIGDRAGRRASAERVEILGG